MKSNLDLSDDEAQAFEGEELVKQTNSPHDLAYLVVEKQHYHSVTRQRAAEKLLKMWEDGRQNGITLDHLAYVGDHADEPYKSKANEIIRTHI